MPFAAEHTGTHLSGFQKSLPASLTVLEADGTQLVILTWGRLQSDSSWDGSRLKALLG